jgi:uncharacterized protein (DUF983 family)
MGEISNLNPLTAAAPRDVWLSLRRGLLLRCPNCGKGKMFGSYLKVNDTCPNCGEELFHHRADDAPAYFTILIVGHVVGSLILLVAVSDLDVPTWLQILVWSSLTVILALTLLPMIKGALVAFQWALRMHGFDKGAENAELARPE